MIEEKISGLELCWNNSHQLRGSSPKKNILSKKFEGEAGMEVEIWLNYYQRLIKDIIHKDIMMKIINIIYKGQKIRNNLE
jgi:hypothetical protein